MGEIHDLQRIDEGQKILELGFNNFLDFSILKRQEIVKKEIDGIIKEKNKINFTKYLETNFLELIELDESMYPETYEICAKSFNFILKQFIENETYKGYLLSGKKGSEMYILREEIITFISEFIDKDIIELLLSNLEKKVITKEKKDLENVDIGKEQEQQQLDKIEDIYDPDNIDSFL